MGIMLSLRFFIVAFGLCFAVVATESSESESNESVEKPGFFGRLMQGAGINWLQGSVSENDRSGMSYVAAGKRVTLAE